MMKQLSKKVIAVMLTGAAILFSYNTAHSQSVTQQIENKLENKEMLISVVNLKIQGMHCQSGCANGIDAMLKEQQGIIKSETSFDRSSAVIEYDPILISEEEIINLITDRGFKVEVVTKKGNIPQD